MGEDRLKCLFLKVLKDIGKIFLQLHNGILSVIAIQIPYRDIFIYAKRSDIPLSIVFGE